MADVFISYSRKHKEFVGRLHEALKQRERDTWVDWEGIPPSAEWQNEIYAAIDAAHSFVFVIGPDSVKSDNCLKEVAHAIERNKRLIPLVRQGVPLEVIPDALRKLNWITFRDTDNFDAAFNLLIKALDTDLDYLRAHTRLLTR
ncbi:MAG: toll/interleukin-1 receptor domain-containing protein, partial [Candidatus Binatia bacterium]